MSDDKIMEKGFVEITTLPVPEATRFIRSLEEAEILYDTKADDSRQKNALLTPSIFGKGGGELITLTIYVPEKDLERASTILAEQLNIVP